MCEYDSRKNGERAGVRGETREALPLTPTLSPRQERGEEKTASLAPPSESQRNHL
jgi:hypothetical protein